MFGLLSALGAIKHFQSGFGHDPLGISFVAEDSGSGLLKNPSTNLSRINIKSEYKLLK
jgi:hypothetical protein